MNKVNVFGSFTQALFFSGVTAIPKFLLEHYAEINLSDKELLLIIHILSVSETEPYPTTEFLAKRLNKPMNQVEEIIANLMERKLLSTERRWDAINKEWYIALSLVGLIEELADCWAIERVKEFEHAKNQETAAANFTEDNPVLERLVSIFEQELARPLTGFECEQIKLWLDSRFSEELILEALRRGVRAGVRSFRYLDSILREWEKKGLKTRAEVELDDENFHSRQTKKPAGKGNTAKKQATNKYENFYL